MKECKKCGNEFPATEGLISYCRNCVEDMLRIPTGEELERMKRDVFTRLDQRIRDRATFKS